jgi:hypothetical protein
MGGRRARSSRPAGGFDGPSRCREGGRTMCAPTGGLSKHFGWRGTVYWGAVGTLGPAGVFYRGFSEDGHGAPGRRALRVGHRTWFVKTGVRAHSLRVECARPSPVRWVSGGRAHNVRPYNRYRKVRRHLRHWASETTNRFRGQVVAREGENVFYSIVCIHLYQHTKQDLPVLDKFAEPLQGFTVFGRAQRRVCQHQAALEIVLCLHELAGAALGFGF